MSARRGLLLTAVAVLAAAVFVSARDKLPAPPLAPPTDLAEWWRANGTAVAALSLARVVGLALCFYLAVVGLVGSLAALTHWSWTESFSRLCATAGVRRLLVGGGLAATLSVPAPGGATDSASFTVFDLGPSGPGIEVRDLGPAVPELDPVTANGDHAAVPSAAVSHPLRPLPVPGSADELDETWEVEPGDHLWHIAAETVADNGGGSDEATITRYWLRLIEHNRDVVGEDPDLIHPGQVIRLPDWQP